MATSLECITCFKDLPVERFSKTQRRELEPECKQCISWRETNEGDAIPTPPPGGGHALREHEKAGTISRVLPTLHRQAPAVPPLGSSVTAHSISGSSRSSLLARGDADDAADNDDTSQFGPGAASAMSGPRSKVFSPASATPRFSHNLPTSAVRANDASASDFTAPSQSGRSAASSRPGQWSTASASASESLSRATTRYFDRHAYSQASSSGASSRGAGDRSSKWPKGDNRKKFDVLPSFE